MEHEWIDEKHGVLLIDKILYRKLKDRIANLDSENTALTKAHLEM